jgi:hypothetical protein
MDWMAYGINVLIVSSSWIAGIILGMFIVHMFRKIFKIESDEDDIEVSGSVSSDDLVDWDKSDKPYIPIKIMRDNGLYYGWFTNNDKFIGQSAKLDEVKLMARDHIIKQLGLRLEFKMERAPKAAAKAAK